MKDVSSKTSSFDAQAVFFLFFLPGLLPELPNPGQLEHILVAAIALQQIYLKKSGTL